MKLQKPSKEQIDAAWREMINAHKVHNIDALRSQGWKTEEELCDEMGLSRPGVRHFLRRNRAIRIAAKSERGNRLYMYRPAVSGVDT